MTLADRLLAERNERGHWTGYLSSSALSTATAIMALHLAGNRQDRIDAGLAWLEKYRNADGGWGDTDRSLSNISTTALCWAAFTLTGRPAPEARAWMLRQTGSLDPAPLARAIAARYGKDQTFSVPILTVLAVAGLVPWSLVPQLPFELAALPQSWFRFLQLPVVSYALPALIAIGHVRWRKGSGANPVRALAAPKTLRVLESIQPANGGFLEATPLTSFVTISLLAAGYENNEVIRRGLGFLEASQRPDGSWPIDTNLATWLTTLSVNVLGDRLPEKEPILEWLLNQQYKERHPFTGAAPGGWAWTDLPGGVPDADDTSGAVLALARLAPDDPRARAAAARGIAWLIDLQNRDGGIPTFCKGWGNLPFDRSSPDITAHALQAFQAWQGKLPLDLERRVAKAKTRATDYLERVQRPDGAWIPLWFGNQHNANEENPVYGTARVLLALDPSTEAYRRGRKWLLAAQREDGSWGSIEETGVALAAIEDEPARVRAEAWLAQATAGEIAPSPIGFYFASLWYHERLYPLIFALPRHRVTAKS